MTEYICTTDFYVDKPYLDGLEREALVKEGSRWKINHIKQSGDVKLDRATRISRPTTLRSMIIPKEYLSYFFTKREAVEQDGT